MTARHPTILHRFRWAVLTVALIVVIAVVAALFAAVQAHHTPSKVADVSGPPGSGLTYELWYARNGDLTFKSTNDLGVSCRDYYGDLTIKNVTWIDEHRVNLTMGNALTVEIHIGRTMRYYG